MALAKTLSVAFEGVSATLVHVEANIGPGLPGTYIVGMASAAVTEAKDRIKTAAHNSGLDWPKTKVIVSLVPGNLLKSGTHFDLAIAVAILSAASTNARIIDSVKNILFLGEIGLDGQLREVPGVLAALLEAGNHNVTAVVVPPGNAAEAALAAGVDVFVATSVEEVMEWINGDRILERPQALNTEERASTRRIDMDQIAGQEHAKFAAEVAAAGGHNLFLIGPRGSGKSMIAERIPTLLPQLNQRERIETTVVHSIAGRSDKHHPNQPPFVAPHHSISPAGLLGGGSGNPKPGAVSLAHNGVLFLDEVSEIPARVLDVLRIPMEQGSIRLVRNQRTVEFPTRFLLVLAANPCRCAAEEPSACSCPASVRANYLNNISGPLKDRIDIFAHTHARGGLSTAAGESSATIAQRVAQARDRARHRWRTGGYGDITTAAMDPCEVRKRYPADAEGMAMLEYFLASGDITQRGVDRALKLAWTLCDLEDLTTPTVDHVARAVELRSAAWPEVTHAA
ncbi:MAG: YifB family Mg chelatase-like AAA ATPase [Corynebacterium sp.]|uniref:YifB family Mg chelatase-like AAA ATPase n=1 Tax=Corynebacterium sp. TaxID=1720 RepID=UPI0026DAA5C7|nr:YifB family Mg chelatase-like AAA ATPase [Corynebacterium sp.]MDO4762282.1 YifB family Mg chelatase-like AAA ATPase [Corynebacterium sp.]